MTLNIAFLIVILIGIVLFYKILEPPPRNDVILESDVDSDEPDGEGIAIEERSSLIIGN